MFNSDNKTTSPSLLDDILVELPQRTDERGSLSFVEAKDFDFQRAFWIYDVPEGSERGGHAHRTCTEMLMAVHGSFEVELYDGHRRINVVLDNPRRAVMIRPMVWCRLYGFSADFVGLCLASHPYQPEGYVNTIEEFEACKS
ncbi:MAG: FdtA/QdtA family cupin domain-containing protein [Bacteroidales bacterium]|nr:FdtA/QdtA family cupin domain-containing protein [Bacteroidales bacterium]